MNTKQFTLQVVVTVTLLIIMNMIIGFYSKKWGPVTNIRTWQSAEPASQLLLGNSTMVGAFDKNEFVLTNHSAVPLLMSAGATKPAEHMLAYQMFPKHQQADLYYGFFDMQLTEDTKSSWSNLTRNRAIGFYSDLDDTLNLYTDGSWLESLRYRLTAALPMILHRESVWLSVEVKRRQLAEMGMPTIESNQFGRVEDFNVNQESISAFRNTCKQHAENRLPLNIAVHGIIKIANHNKSKIYIIEMPIKLVRRKQYHFNPEWSQYHAYLLELLRDANVTYINAIDWVPDDKFTDAFHVNAEGAKIFTRRLVEETIGRK